MKSRGKGQFQGFSGESSRVVVERQVFPIQWFLIEGVYIDQGPSSGAKVLSRLAIRSELFR